MLITPQKFSPRIEYKYYISPVIRPYLFQDLSNFVILDSHITGQRNNYYSVASIYFENYYFQSYFDKIDGEAKRVKLRLRFYPPWRKNQLVNVELKYKIFDRCFKQRTRIEPELFNDLCASNFVRLENGTRNTILRNFLIEKERHHLQPFIRIDYQRIAWFALNDDKVRITFDFNVRCAPFLRDIKQEPYIPVLTNQLGILEVKTSGYFPFWLSNIIKKFSLKRLAISKYSLSVQNLAINNFYREIL